MIARFERNVRGRGQNRVRTEKKGLLQVSGPAGHLLGAILAGLILGVTLGAIAGSIRLAVGFGVGFGLLGGLVCVAEIRRGDAM